MPELKNIEASQVDTAIDDLKFQDFEIVDKTQQADGRWTISYREKPTAGLSLTPDDGAALVPDAEAAQPAANPPPGAQTIGVKGANLIKAFEDCAKRAGQGQFRPYNDAIGVLTIGWGHTNKLGTNRFDNSALWSQQKCDEVFLQDMAHFEDAVHKLVRVPLNQDQFDALVSFCYNCGAGNLAKSTLLKKVNARDFAGAAQEFKKWVKANGQTLKGLVRRRNSESLLFRSIPDSNFDGQPD
jgi:lysozyme